jgi:hypothetical protein
MRRLAAISLIALGALPFTAPFATCDLSGLLSDRQALACAPVASVASLVSESAINIVPVRRTARRTKRPLSPSVVRPGKQINRSRSSVRAVTTRLAESHPPPDLFSILRI